MKDVLLFGAPFGILGRRAEKALELGPLLLLGGRGRLKRKRWIV